jgi:hypothetical protein
MVWPLVAGAAIAGGIAGSLFNKGARPPNIGEQIAQLKANATRQRGITTDLTANLQKGYEPYKAQVFGALDDYDKRGSDEAGKFLEEMGKTTDLQGNDMRMIARRNINSQVNPSIRAIREAMAAGPGVESSATANSLTDLGTNLAEQHAQAETSIDMQALQNKSAALQSVHADSVDRIQKRMGVTTEMLAGLHAEGRDDLIREAALMSGINDSETEGIIQLLNFRESGTMAADSAAAARRQELWNGMVNLGGKMIAPKA